MKLNNNLLIDFLIKMYSSYLYIFLTKCIIYNYFKQHIWIELIKIEKSNSILNEIYIDE